MIRRQLVSRYATPIWGLLALTLAVSPVGAGAAAGAPVGVEELMRHPSRHGGPVEVEGVVSRVFPETGTMALIDTAEFVECQVVTCAKLTLPVRWAGPMPAVASTVRVKGQVERQGIRSIFAASALETVSPPPASK